MTSKTQQQADALSKMDEDWGLLQNWLFRLLVFLILCKAAQKYQTAPVQLYYSHTNTLFNDFVRKTRIKSMEFRPYFLAPTILTQTLFYLFNENRHQRYGNAQYDFDLFKA